MARLKILLIAPYFLPQHHGGAARLFDQLLAGLRRLDGVLYADGQASDPRRIEQHDRALLDTRGYRVVRGVLLLPALPAGIGMLAKIGHLMRWLTRAMLDWRRVLRREAPQVVVAGNVYAGGWLMNRVPGRLPRAARRSARAPALKVHYVHGEELTQDTAYGPLSRHLHKAMLDSLRGSDLVIAVSRFSADLVRSVAGVPADRVVVVPNAVDVDRFVPLGAVERAARRRALGWSGRTVLLSVTRLIPRKGVDQVLRALDGARGLPEDWLYVVAGTGDSEAELRQLARTLGLDGRVRFLGYVADADLPGLYGAADVFIQANRRVRGDTEGFGIVFLEASASGTPVIGGTDGGTADAIEDGVSGLRVDAQSIEDVRRAIVTLMGDPALRARMAVDGRRRVEEGFSTEVYVQRFEDVVLDAWQRRQAEATSAP